MDIKNFIAAKIRFYRKERGMTQKELGEKIGVKHNTVSGYESGVNEPEQNILFKIAAALDISINDLFPQTTATTKHTAQQIANPMKLGELIKQYRDEHGYSQRKMAEMIGCSYAYVGMLEKGINPKTQRELSPTLDIFKKTADAFGIELDTLLKMVDGDQPITVAPAPAPDDTTTFSPTEQKIDARTRRQLEAVLDDDNLTYNGVVLDGDDKEKVKKALELIFWDVKEKNKRKKD